MHVTNPVAWAVVGTVAGDQKEECQQPPMELCSHFPLFCYQIVSIYLYRTYIFFPSGKCFLETRDYITGWKKEGSAAFTLATSGIPLRQVLDSLLTLYTDKFKLSVNRMMRYFSSTFMLLLWIFFSQNGPNASNNTGLFVSLITFF